MNPHEHPLWSYKAPKIRILRNFVEVERRYVSVLEDGLLVSDILLAHVGDLPQAHSAYLVPWTLVLNSS